MVLQNEVDTLKMKERDSMEDCTKTTCDLWSKLVAFNKKILESVYINLPINGLLQSFEMIIQGITNQSIFPSYKVVVGKLLTENHGMQL